MNEYKKILICLILPITMVFFGWSQKGTGKLAGKISEISGNQTIAGVTVSAKSVGKGAQSITDGSYILALPPGTYTISFTHKSYQPKEITEVQIKAGETTYLNIILDIASTQLKGVVVTTSIRREAQSAIYNRQKTSSAESDGISIEAIRKTPDNNAGQIMKRITGVNVQDNRFVVVRGLGDQYNQTMLNGVLMSSTESDRNAFALDLIPSAVIDNIVVNKTATPDMPGNFAGGIVQINTKDFPTNDFFSVELGAGFASQTIGKDFYSDPRGKYEWLGFGTSIRELPKDFPAVTNRVGDITKLNVTEQQRYLRQLKNNIVPVNYGPSKPNSSIQFGFGKTFRFKNESQFGIVLAGTSRKTELIEHEITARDPLLGQEGSPSDPQILGLNYYSENTRYRYYSNLGGVLNLAYSFGKNKITLKTLYTQIYNNNYTERPQVRTSVDRFPGLDAFHGGYGLTFFAEQKNILNIILGGDHRTGKENETHLDWNVNITQINTNTPDIRNFIFVGNKDSILRTNTNVSSAQQALQQNGRVWSKDADYVYGGAFNVTTPFYLSDKKQFFRAGLLYQNRERKATAVVVIYTDLANSLDSILAPSNFYSPYGARLSGFSGISSANGTYNAGSSLLAAYTSVENRIGDKLRIIWGIRAEDYQQYVNIYDPVYYPNFNQYDLNIEGLAARTTFNFLPSVNLVYALSNKINLRAAYSNTVVRPELKDLADFPRYNYQTFTLSQGNPGLKSTSIRNYDFKFEYFPSSGEILSFAAFYKDLRNPIEYARNPTFEVFLQPLNVGTATVAGLEAEIRKRMDFISSAAWLKNITLFGNGTLLNSNVPDQTLNDPIYPSIAKHTLTGQPPYIVNAGINISAFKNTFDASLTFNRTGDYIFQLGSADRHYPVSKGDKVLLTPNSRVNPRNQLDLVVSQTFFNNKLKLRFSVNNLLNEPFNIYQDVNANGKMDAPIILKPTGSPEASYQSGMDSRSSSIDGQIGYFFYISYTF